MLTADQASEIFGSEEDEDEEEEEESDDEDEDDSEDEEEEEESDDEDEDDSEEEDEEDEIILISLQLPKRIYSLITEEKRDCCSVGVKQSHAFFWYFIHINASFY